MFSPTFPTLPHFTSQLTPHTSSPALSNHHSTSCLYGFWGANYLISLCHSFLSYKTETTVYDSPRVAERLKRKLRATAWFCEELTWGSWVPAVLHATNSNPTPLGTTPLRLSPRQRQTLSSLLGTPFRGPAPISPFCFLPHLKAPSAAGGSRTPPHGHLLRGAGTQRLRHQRRLRWRLYCASQVPPLSRLVL